MDAGLMWAPCLTGGLNGICIKLNLFHLSHQIHTLNLVPWIEYEIGVIQDEFEKLIWYHCAQSVLGKKGRWHSKDEVNLWNISSRLFVSDRVRGTDPILIFFVTMLGEFWLSLLLQCFTQVMARSHMRLLQIRKVITKLMHPSYYSYRELLIRFTKIGLC